MPRIAKDRLKDYASHTYPVFNNMGVVTPSDVDELPFVAEALSVTDIKPDSDGTKRPTLKFTTVGGQEITMLDVAEGLINLPIRVRKVWATDTTNMTLFAFW